MANFTAEEEKGTGAKQQCGSAGGVVFKGPCGAGDIRGAGFYLGLGGISFSLNR